MIIFGNYRSTSDSDFLTGAPRVDGCCVVPLINVATYALQLADAVQRAWQELPQMRAFGIQRRRSTGALLRSVEQGRIIVIGDARYVYYSGHTDKTLRMVSAALAWLAGAP